MREIPAKFRNTRRVAIVAGVLGVMVARSGAAQTPPPNATSSLGANLHFFQDWASEYSLVDAFKQSRTWLTQCSILGGQSDCTSTNQWDTGEAALLDLDADGWVRSLPAPGDAPRYWMVGTVMFGGTDGHYPAGRYTVLYDGEGNIAYGMGAVKNVALSSTGRDVIDVTPTNGQIYLQITSTDPRRVGNYIRNIRVLMPGTESSYLTQPFHPDFLAKVQRYKVLRFMLWGETNASTLVHWADRPLTTNARYTTTGKGVPYEVMIDLANRTQADAWINVPHQADDDFIRQLALLVRGRLGSSQKVYVEYSNEVWNDAGGFTQGQWVEQRALETWPGGTDSAFTKRMNWHGRRTAEMCDLFKGAWGTDTSRVRCVLGAQASNIWTASQAADCPMWTAGAPCSAHGIDGIATAPYISFSMGEPATRSQVLAWSTASNGLDSLFNEIFYGGVLTGGYPGGVLARVANQMQQAQQIAAARGLASYAYEAGTDLHDTSSDAGIRDFFAAANRDARMGQAFDQYFPAWQAAGGQIMVHFVNVAAYDQLGSCGALEYMDQTASPKYDAIQRFLTSTACWWGCKCGDGVIDRGEQCDDFNTQNGDCCSSACQFEPSTTVCRGSAGTCDAVEYCTGASATCPGDAKSTAVCRPIANACDVAAESCTGTANTCPADGATRDCSGQTTTCRTGYCDPTLGCTWSATNQGGACDDGNAATTGTVCIDGTCSLPYPLPMITALTPTSANLNGAAMTLTVTGSQFVPASWVTWDGVTLATTYVSATQLTAAVPAANLTVSGYHTINVVTPAPGGGTSGPRSFAVNNPVPVFTAMSPTQATLGAASAVVTVGGSSFVSGATVNFNGTAVATTFNSSAQLIATIPGSLLGTAGNYPMTVTNPAPGGGTSTSRTFTVNNPAATITTLTPASAAAGSASVTLTVDGSNFLVGALIVWNGTYPVTTRVSSTRLTTVLSATQLATPSSNNVQVSNPGPVAGLSNTLVFTVTGNAPTLTTITPASVATGAAFTLTLDGTNFQTGSTVSFGGTAVTATYVSTTRLTAAIPATAVANEGTYSVTVTNPGTTGGTSAARTLTTLRPLLFSIGASTATLGGVAVADEDIVRYDRATGAYSLYFDGSARGIPTSADIDAFFVGADGSIYVSFDANTTVAGISAAPEDILRYVPSTNTWSMYFDGSDVGLSGTSENIDGLHILADGRILVSVTGTFSVPGVTGEDEDIIAFTPTSLGANTAGTWAMYFDGSAVGLAASNNLDIDGFSVLPDGSLLFSFVGSATLTNVGAVTGDDVVRFVPSSLGTATAGTFSMYLQAATVGLSGGVDELF